MVEEFLRTGQSRSRRRRSVTLWGNNCRRFFVKNQLEKIGCVLYREAFDDVNANADTKNWIQGDPELHPKSIAKILSNIMFASDVTALERPVVYPSTVTYIGYKF